MKKSGTKWNGGRVKDVRDFAKSSKIIPVNIGEYNTERVTIYGANMVMARHLPFIIDGLKPVARRTLTSIYRAAKGKPTTMPNAIAETMKIHPHGDSSIYDCIILMAQPWKKMIPMIDSLDENYGSAAGFGDKEADARYLKTRLSDYALDCFFSDYDEKVVEMKPNFDDNGTEPLYLPAKYPNLFINGGDGLAWGYSTEIPVYNVNDILEYTIHLIQNPEKRFRDLIPDSPTGCYVVDSPEVFEKLQFEGFLDEDVRSHTFTMQSVITKNEKAHTLTVESFPPQRTTEAFFKGIDEMREEGILVGCTKVKNECQGEVIKITLCFKPEVNLDEVRELLYSTKLGTRAPFSAQVAVIDSKNTSDLCIQRYSVEQCLLQWIAYRRDFKRRFYHRKIVESKARVHQINEMLEVFSKDNYSTTIKIIRDSESRDDLIQNLISEYDIDTVQANAIANMRQYENVKGIRKKYKKERDELVEDIEELIDLVKTTKKIDKVIVKELREGIEKYGEPRRSKVITLPGKGYVPNTEHTIIVTAKGMIKKLANNVKNIGKIAADDVPMEVKVNVFNRDTLLVFDSIGRVHCIPIKTIRGVDLSHLGYPISTFSKSDNAVIVAVFILREDGSLYHPDFKPGSNGYFLFTTKCGIIKKTAFSEYVGLKNSSIGAKIREDDSLISVKYIDDDSDIITFTFMGQGLRYHTDTVSDTARNTIGVKAIEIDENDYVRDTVILSPKDEYLLIVTMKGYVKKIKLENLNSQARNKDSNVITGLREGDMMLYAHGVTDRDTYVAVTKEGSFEFDIIDVEAQYKMGKGNKLIPIKKGDLIVKIVKK